MQLNRIIQILGHKLLPKTKFESMMVIMISLFGSLTMLSALACVKFMPVSDATVLMFTTPLFTMVLASITKSERLTTLKITCGNH